MRIGFHRGSRDTPLINITQAESAITTRAGYRHKERPSILPLHPSVRQRLECRRLRKQIRGLVCFSVGAPGSGANIILTNGLEHAQPELWICGDWIRPKILPVWRRRQPNIVVQVIKHQVHILHTYNENQAMFS